MCLAIQGRRTVLFMAVGGGALAVEAYLVWLHRALGAGLAILLMEVVGAIIATFAIYRAGESSRPTPSEGLPGTAAGELRG